MVRRLTTGGPHSEHRLVRVTARLQSGVVLPSVFPAPLDGVLASAARRETLGGAYGSVVDHHTVRLPLRRIRDGLGARWVWAATCARPDPGAVEETRWWNKRFDTMEAERIVAKLPANTDVGRTKAEHVPLTVTVTARLTWHAIGDPAEIERLLGLVPSVGKKRAQGEGHVLSWQVDDLGEPDLASIVWAEDGHPGRPLPARAAPLLGLDAPDTIGHQYRPPYWRPPLTPDGRTRESPQVIAPWVTRS